MFCCFRSGQWQSTSIVSSSPPPPPSPSTGIDNENKTPSTASASQTASNPIHHHHRVSILKSVLSNPYPSLPFFSLSFHSVEPKTVSFLFLQTCLFSVWEGKQIIKKKKKWNKKKLFKKNTQTDRQTHSNTVQVLNIAIPQTRYTKKISEENRSEPKRFLFFRAIWDKIGFSFISSFNTAICWFLIKVLIFL